MKNFQSLAFWKKPSVILALILAAFFLKGVFLVTLFPIFAGQDETKHFNSVGFLSEPRPITWSINKNIKKNTDGMQKGNYTEEILETGKAVNFDEEIKGEIYNTPSFEKGFFGKNERTIDENNWKKYNEDYPVSYAGNSLYHRIASTAKKLFGQQNILTDYFLIRIFSVLLGTLTVLFSYFIAKNIGFSAKHSLILTAIIAFQPRFSIYSAAINYDPLLILMFTLFTLGGVLALRQGLNWKNFLLIIASIYLGIQTKPTANILLVAAVLLFAYFAYEKIKNKNKNVRYAAYSLIIFAIIFFSLYLKNRFIGNAGSLGNIATSVKNYLSESLTMGRFGLSSRTYWGALGWTNNWFLDKATNIIWAIEAFSAMGIALLLIPKKYLLVTLNLARNLYRKLTSYVKMPNYQSSTYIEKLDFLPEKKYIIFLLGMLVLLQLGIRFADWIFFQQMGNIETGTPGRYFLPNLVAHIILVFTGLGMLLRKKEYFEKSLIVGLILMMTFMMYIIFDVIILRYYL